MCDPVTIAIALGTQLASTALQNKAASKVSKARAAAIRGTNADLDRYRATATEALQRSSDASSRDAIDQATADATANRTEAYQAPVKMDDLLPGQGNSSDAVKQSIVNTLTGGVQKSQDLGRRRGAFDAYGDATFNRDVAMHRGGQEINQQGNFSTGRSSILPIELEAANNAGSKYAALAGIVNAAGTVAGAGYGKFASSPSMYNTGSGSTGINWLKGQQGYYGPGF